MLINNANVNQQRNNGVTPLMSVPLRGYIEVCECLLQSNLDVNLKDQAGNNTLFYDVHRQKKYGIQNLLIQHDIEMNIVGDDGKSILETANATYDSNIISLIKKNQNMKTVNKEIMKTRTFLKKL